MSLWRRTAIERFHSLQKEIAAADNPYGVWIELRYQMNRAYEREPVDDGSIAAIYGYGSWCLTGTRNAELATAAIVCFYEHLPTDPLIRADVGRWLSVDDFNGLKNVFGYHLNEREVDDFALEFLAQKKRMAGGQRPVRRQEPTAASPTSKRKAHK